MPEGRTFTLHQADQARTDFYGLESELGVVKAQLTPLLTRCELAQAALAIIFATAVLVLAGIEALSR